MNLFEYKTYHEVIDEIYYKVTHLEPWEKGSRKTAGQTGMCGGVSMEQAGVGAVGQEDGRTDGHVWRREYGTGRGGGGGTGRRPDRRACVAV